MVRKWIIFFLSTLLFAGVECKIEQEKIICTYFIDRSDNAHGLTVEFHWYSPDGKDDRVRSFKVPPYYGSVYDYRFLPGRERGRWRVVAKELETNRSAQTSFDLNSSSEDFFED